jgi:hypothetical protein
MIAALENSTQPAAPGVEKRLVQGLSNDFPRFPRFDRLSWTFPDAFRSDARGAVLIKLNAAGIAFMIDGRSSSAAPRLLPQLLF